VIWNARHYKEKAAIRIGNWKKEKNAQLTDDVDGGHSTKTTNNFKWIAMQAKLNDLFIF
jgi:hypothetical protein